MYDDNTSQAFRDQALSKEILRQIYKARNVARDRRSKAEGLKKQVGDLKLNEGKRKAQFYELRAKNLQDWKNLTRSTKGAMKAEQILGAVLEQSQSGTLWETKKDRNTVVTLLILATAADVFIAERRVKLDNRVRILDNIKNDMKEIIAIKDFDDVERRTTGHMATRVAEIVQATRAKMEERFRNILDVMTKKSSQLQRLLNRFENERHCLIHAQRQGQMDIVNLLMSDNDYLKNVGEMIYEFVGKPEFFEFRQITDAPSNMLKTRVDAARVATIDVDSSAPIPKVADVQLDIKKHLEKSDDKISISDPFKLKVIESDVNFSELWKIHVQRQEVLRAIQDRVELTGLLIKLTFERVAFATATRTEVREGQIDENGNINMIPIEDPWCQRIFNEEEVHQFVGKAVFNKNRDFLR